MVGGIYTSEPNGQQNIYKDIIFSNQIFTIKIFLWLSGYKVNIYSFLKNTETTDETQKLLKTPMTSTVHNEVPNILIHIYSSKLLLMCILFSYAITQ